MAVPADNAAYRLLKVLRVTRSETQWTQIIAAACVDEAIASGFVRAILESADQPHARMMLDRLPASLICEPEVAVNAADGTDLGRVDLRFRDASSTFVLLAELKLGSAYGDRQLERYCDALRSNDAPIKGLVAITTHTPFEGEEVAVDDPGWAGSVRWSKAWPAFARICGNDSLATQIWQVLLQVLRDEKDFGPMDLDASAIAAWARYSDGEQIIRYLLTEIAQPAEALLGQGPLGSAKVVQRGKAAGNVVVPWRDRPHLVYRVPQTLHEDRVWIQFHANGGEPYFSVEARYQHPREALTGTAVQAATEYLQAQGFGCGNDGLGYFWARTADVSAVLDGAQSVDRLLDVTREAVAHLHASGIFEALAATSPSTPASPTDIPAQE